MKNKTIAIIGIGAYILSVITSATDPEGNFRFPIALIAISGILTIIFIVAATVRLWKGARYVSIILASSAVILFILSGVQSIASPSYGSPMIILLNTIRLINFITFIWAVSLLWAMAKFNKSKINETVKDLGLTPEEGALVQEDLLRGDRESAVQRIATSQDRQRTKFKEATGIDVRDIILEIGSDISWADIVRHVFRVVEFDRASTTIGQNDQVKPLSSFKPYGYLLVESPILNQRVRLPIIHRDDFMLAASVFDEPRLSRFVIDEELLVTYAPKQKGLSGSPSHVLHYVITPRGTLDFYYSMNNDAHMAKPDPEKLFGPFVYEGMIKVQMNPEPKL